MTDYDDWTAGDLAEHCEWLAKKGYMKKATASAMRTAVVKVFGYVEGEEWQSTSVKDIDVDDVLTRFANKAKKDFSPGSLSTYQTRFKKALESYVKYMTDPANYQAPVKTRQSRPANGESRRTNGSASNKPADESDRGDAGKLEAADGFEVYPFPIRRGVTAHLRLPADLTSADVQRLTAFLETLTIDDRPDPDA